MAQVKTLRWVIAHEPEYLFTRTARAFGDALNEISQGSIKIEIWTQKDYYDRLHNGVRDEITNIDRMIKELEEGKFDMFQTNTAWYRYANNNFMAIDLPFLFRDHDHATRVFEGYIGKALCDSLSEKTNLKGLAFTYSGGFRVLGSKQPLHSIEDIKGKRIKTYHPAHYLTHLCLGAEPVTGPIDSNIGYDTLESEEVDTVDTTYLRFKGNHILRTNHSMYTTTITMNKDVWNSLDAETQKFLEQAAVTAARLEREWSVQDAEDFEKNCALNGITIVDISEEERDILRQQSEAVYEQSKDWFSPGLIESIRMQ